jgi:hypothetical protein
MRRILAQVLPGEYPRESDILFYAKAVTITNGVYIVSSWFLFF